MEKKTSSTNRLGTRKQPRPTSTGTCPVTSGLTPKSELDTAASSNEIPHSEFPKEDVVRLASPIGNSFSPNASVNTARAEKMTTKRTTRRGNYDKTSSPLSCDATRNEKQDHEGTNEFVAPGAFSVPGTDSSLVSPNNELNDTSEFVGPGIVDRGGAPSLVVAAQLVNPNNHNEDWEHRIEQEVESRLMNRDPRPLVAKVVSPSNTTTARATWTQFWWKWKYVLGLVLLGICGAIVGGMLSAGRSDETPAPEVSFSTSDPSIDESPTPSPTRSEGTPAKIMDVLRRYPYLAIDEDATTGSPQSQALEWLLFEDTNSLTHSQNDTLSETVILERYALAVIYYSTEGGSWTSQHYFLANSNVCNWNNESDISSDDDVVRLGRTGVYCDADAKVEEIWLPQNRLNGTIPSELYLLSKLQTLELEENYLENIIPVELARLTALRALNLYDNDLSGTLPSELGALVTMTDLSVGGNKLNGTLPTELGKLADIEQLDLSSNDFMGTLPTELGQLTAIEQLDLAGNDFTGTLPTELGQLTAIENIYLSVNRFTGTLPANLGKCTVAKELLIDNNEFTGPLPTELGRMIGLSWLDIESNNVNGTLPSELGNLTAMETLYLSYNQFTGTLPTELGLLTVMSTLWVNSNDLTGTLPTELGSLIGVQELDLSHNEFSGTLPTELGHMAGLQAFSAYSNQLTGTVPTELGQVVQLFTLYIYSNYLSGTIPAELREKPGLEIEFKPQLTNGSDFE